jgi:hypothetical protein
MDSLKQSAGTFVEKVLDNSAQGEDSSRIAVVPSAAQPDSDDAKRAASPITKSPLTARTPILTTMCGWVPQQIMNTMNISISLTAVQFIGYYDAPGPGTNYRYVRYTNGTNDYSDGATWDNRNIAPL